MHTLQLLHNAIPEAEREPLPSFRANGTCAVTGITGTCVPRGDLFGKSFTDQHILKYPDSPLVSVEAWTSLRYKWERMSSWLCDGQVFHRLDRKAVREHVINGVDQSLHPRWAGYITTSYKKHGSLRAPVNSGKRQVWLFEMLLVDCTDRSRLGEWWRVKNDAIRSGVSRTSQETLDMPPGIIRKVGVDTWTAYRTWAIDKWQSPLYQLLTYLLPSQDELKAEAAGVEHVKESPPKPVTPERVIDFDGEQMSLF